MFDAIGTHQELHEGLERSKQYIGAQIAAQQAAMDTIDSPGALDTKAKLLVAIGVVALTRCQDCVSLHIPKLLAAGATKAEVMEAAAVAISFGGGPTMAFVCTVIEPACDQFASVVNADATAGSGLFN
ncbi:MAG: carboxymuconolactone decarboxylase family protein [Actinomycetes bacterium]